MTKTTTKTITVTKSESGPNGTTTIETKTVISDPDLDDNEREYMALMERAGLAWRAKYPHIASGQVPGDTNAADGKPYDGISHLASGQ